jgi:uroporphyrinogen III methyltransferase / synthase
MTVYLVGAGPGDPGLMTVRGAEVLGRADLVVHDRLADSALLDLAPSDAERVDVGKRPGSPVRQEEINALLVEAGKSGKEVVRLKGGDPFVFGRGGEEAAALREAGVDFEVVPGITAAVAVPAYAGVPVTHRGLSTTFSVVTGHSAAGEDSEVDWDAVAAVGGTLVVLMGVAHRAAIAKRLIESGRAPTTPVVAVRWGTRSSQTTLRTTLEQLGEVELEPPATIVVGEVAGLDLSWFESRPLLGWRVVVPRARAQASALSRLLRREGAEPVEVPLIGFASPIDGGEALARAAARVSSFDWVVFTSANAVERFVSLLSDARAFGNARVAAIGPATADALAARGVAADLVPERFVAEGLLEVFPVPSGGGRVLLPRAAKARSELPEGLASLGWSVEVVEAYRTVKPPVTEEQEEAMRRATAVTFTSSSTVKGLVEGVGKEAIPPVVACIGPVTAGTARSLGLEVAVEAREYTLPGLVDALVCHARSVR